MSDILSAASLLLGVSGVLFGIWYPVISGAIAAKIPDDPKNRKLVRKQVKNALRGMANILALVTVPAALIFIPDFLSIIIDALGRIRDLPAAFRSYDSVRTAFCLVEVLLGGIAVYALSLRSSLKSRLNEIGEEPPLAAPQPKPKD